MKVSTLDEYKRGWFIGNFEPSLLKTKGFEVGVKSYEAGNKETPHFHKVATEFTVIINGLFKINGETYTNGQIIQFSPGEVADFECLKSGTTVVIKLPSITDDKYTV